MKRLIDIVISLGVLLIIAVPLILLMFFILMVSRTSPIYWSVRIGARGAPFQMPKLRTMIKNTPQVATDLLTAPQQYLLPGGQLIRKLSLDELPQLYSVLIGKMSLVGPRPALFNQHKLISLRKQLSLDELLPGVTGWAQINGRDENSDERKVELDLFYERNRSLLFDLKILALTILKVAKADNVHH